MTIIPLCDISSFQWVRAILLLSAYTMYMHLQQYCSHLSKFCRSTVFEEKEKVLWQFCQCLCCRHRLAKTFVIFFVIISDVFESERILHYGDGNPYHKSKVLIYQLFPRTFFVYFSMFFFFIFYFL